MTRSVVQLLLLLLIGPCGWAQTQKGTFALNTQLGVGIWRLEGAERSSGRVAPGIGYFLRDNTLVGLNMLIGQTTTRFSRPDLLPNNITRIEEQSFGIGLMARRYLSTGRFKPFIHAEATYQWGRFQPFTNQNQSLRRSTGSYANAMLGLGGAYFVTDRLGLEASALMVADDLENIIESRKLQPFNRYLLLNVGATWALSRPKN